MKTIRVYLIIITALFMAAPLSLCAEETGAAGPAVKPDSGNAADEIKAVPPRTASPENGSAAGASVKTGEKTADTASGIPDEGSLFGGETVSDGKNVISDAITSVIDKERVGFSGSLASRNSYIMSRDWMSGDDGQSNVFNAWFQANFNLDIRLFSGVKAFINASLDYYPTETTDLSTMTTYGQNEVVYPLEEIFIDVNIRKLAYFRIGKQFLKWGAGYFWNPTDVINIERRNILDPHQVREGVYGLKVHVPAGTRFNFYAFLNFNDAKDIDRIGVAGKAEVLLGNTEMALSAAWRRDSHPVIGYEITSRLFTVDLRGEVSVSPGTNGNVMHLDDTGAGTVAENPDGWTTMICFGMGRGFDVLNVHDRIRLDLEFFYNHGGYTEKIFDDADFATKLNFVTSGCYAPNYYGRFYGGLFMTISQIGVSELSASVNYIINMEDQSNIISAMLTWAPIYNLELSLALNGFPGPANAEYTATGYALQTEISVRVVF